MQLGVSRTPLREAFRLLEADGLVVLHPNRGAQVVALSENDIREYFEMMGALEALSGELACRRIGDAEIVEIKALTFEMLACHARRDLPAYYHRNREIHDRINLAAGNARLHQTYASLNLRIQHLRFRSNYDDDKWSRAAREHAQMVEALEARDAAGLAALMRVHLQQKGRGGAGGDAQARACRGRRAVNAPQPLHFHPPRTDGDLARRLRQAVGGDVLFDAAARGRYATDASIYQVRAGRRAGARERRGRARGVRRVPRAAHSDAAARRGQLAVRADGRRGARHRSQQASQQGRLRSTPTRGR